MRECLHILARAQEVRALEVAHRMLCNVVQAEAARSEAQLAELDALVTNRQQELAELQAGVENLKRQAEALQEGAGGQEEDTEGQE